MPRMICKKCGCRPDLRGCSRYEECSSFCDPTIASLIRNSQCGCGCGDNKHYPMCYRFQLLNPRLLLDTLIDTNGGGKVKILSQDTGFFEVYYKVVESIAGSSLDGESSVTYGGKTYGPAFGIPFLYEAYNADGSGPILFDDVGFGPGVLQGAISWLRDDSLGYCPSDHDPTKIYLGGYLYLQSVGFDTLLGDHFFGYVSFDPRSGETIGDQQTLPRCDGGDVDLTAHIIGQTATDPGTGGTWGTPGQLHVVPVCERLVYTGDNEDQSGIFVTQSCIEHSWSAGLPEPGETPDFDDPDTYHHPGRCSKFLSLTLVIWDPDAEDFVTETAILDGSSFFDEERGSPFQWTGTTDGGTIVTISVFNDGPGSDRCCPDDDAETDCENCGDSVNEPHELGPFGCRVCWKMVIVTTYGCTITVYFGQQDESCPNGDEWLDLTTTRAETTCTAREEPGMPGVPRTDAGAYFSSAVTFALCDEDGNDVDHL